jgi:predicted PilT family ATPase
MICVLSLFVFFTKELPMSNDIDAAKESRNPVGDEEFAIKWTEVMLSGDGTVQEVAELLGLSKDYVQQRSVQLRRELKEHNGTKLPKASGRPHKKKDTAGVAKLVADILKSHNLVENVESHEPETEAV